MNFFCTFFDKRYLARGVALYHSLLAQGAPFHLWVLCMDREVEVDLSSRSLQNVTLATVADLERSDPRVMTARQNRTLVEFYFTSKSFLCQYVFDSRPDVDIVTYVDADGYFFGSPETILVEMNGYSVGLTGHRFPARLNPENSTAFSMPASSVSVGTLTDLPPWHGGATNASSGVTITSTMDGTRTRDI